MAPDVVVAMLAWENKEMGRYYSKMINQNQTSLTTKTYKKY
jgi:hypothetical protein